VRALLRATVLALAATACAASTGDDDARTGALRPVERKIVGAARPYDADPSLRARTAELAGNVAARRKVAWHALAKILRPVTLTESKVLVGGKPPTLPLFRTWYGKDDLERVFAKIYAAKSPAARAARAPITDGEVDAAFAWNASDQGSFADDDYLARIAKVSDPESAHGLAGNARVAYSPGFVRHMVKDYAAEVACLPKLGSFARTDAPPSASNFAPCFSAEFPIDAALVKASFFRADFGMTLPTHRTDAATIAKRMSGALDDGGWAKGEGTAAPTAAEIYTLKTSDGSTFRMPALHLVTKELREWLWITLFWAEDPDTDFGADRPQEIRDLGGPWAHYKMNVVVAYEEEASDPGAGLPPSLASAMRAGTAGGGAPSWASNPYLERGAKNAQTNCIGCHQHAGDPGLSSEAVLADPSLPASGRTKVRANFPADYVWSFDFGGEELARILERQVEHYDGVDR
jgi:hypothetical protein